LLGFLLFVLDSFVTGPVGTELQTLAALVEFAFSSQTPLGFVAHQTFFGSENERPCEHDEDQEYSAAYSHDEYELLELLVLSLVDVCKTLQLLGTGHLHPQDVGRLLSLEVLYFIRDVVFIVRVLAIGYSAVANKTHQRLSVIRVLVGHLHLKFEPRLRILLAQERFLFVWKYVEIVVRSLKIGVYLHHIEIKQSLSGVLCEIFEEFSIAEGIVNRHDI